MNEAEILESIGSYTRFPPRGKINIFSDTTQFMSIKADDVLELNGGYYLVRGEEVEGRFGLDGEPKYWVKRAIDLSDGSSKVIKLVFNESFLMQLGSLQIQCFRSPLKEARILEKTHHDMRFMQGFNVRDTADNAVRIIDRIQGTRYYDYIHNLDMDHETYFHGLFRAVFKNIIETFEAINHLHHMNELHGDIRNDHILIDRPSGVYTWIDFDYTYDWSENFFGIDLYGLGNILLFTVGKGFHTIPDLNACGPEGFKVKECLTQGDLSLFFKHRIVNLRKLFPYIPDSLNLVLLHFGQEAEVFYEHSDELLSDLKACEADLPQ
jgi:hypothetical protein